MGEAVIQSWISALARGDEHTAGKLLSPVFGIHDGMTRAQYLAHELLEFRKRCIGFGVPEKPAVIFDAHAGGRVRVFVLNSSGKFAYEDWLHLGDDGLIVGNGRMIEVVTKMHFDQSSRHPRRAMAIRSHGLEILKVIPLFDVSSTSFERCDTYADDRFEILSYEDREPPISMERMFRALTTRGGLSFSAIMRGMDHPHFIPGRFPSIDGDSVMIDIDHGPIWSLTVRLEDGGVQTVECPQERRIGFGARVVSATVTDAVDNDWTANEGRGE